VNLAVVHLTQRCSKVSIVVSARRVMLLNAERTGLSSYSLVFPLALTRFAPGGSDGLLISQFPPVNVR